MTEQADRLQSLISDEVDAAIAKYGDLRSMHEAYAVMLEECQELDEESGDIIETLAGLWDDIRDKSSNTELLDQIIAIQDGAIKTIEHAIQVAAVATLALKTVR